MNCNNYQNPLIAFPFPARVILYFLIVVLMSNINAVVDIFQHPDIPYLDEEHIIVGSVTGITSIIILVILENYFRHLNEALSKIKYLESYLCLCANCKKIRIPGSVSDKQESWIQIEEYITNNTETKFSHGICPDCAKQLYPDMDIYKK